MTLLDIVERERRKVARHLGVASTAWIIAGVLVVLLIGTLLLGDARWLGLPRIAPFAIWLVILGGWMVRCPRVAPSHATGGLGRRLGACGGG